MEQPLVSVLIRTCGRPDVLRMALNSLEKQTYGNIEVIIVEDGENISEQMIKNEYKGLHCRYEATGKKAGRCEAGNRAMELANGKYLNFLDDDDAFFPEHIEQLVSVIEHCDERAVYSIAQERQIIKNTQNYTDSVIKKKIIRYQQPFHKLLLYTMNYIPIQSIMFEKTLFEELGGLDKRLDTLEDWDLWVRYSTVTDFRYVDRVTSCYHTPYQRKRKQKRSEELKNYTELLHEKFCTYQTQMSVEQINKEMQYVIREYKDRGLIRYLRIFFRVVFLGER